MTFTFDPDIKERVRAATDIVDLVGSRLELRRQGANYAAICPWHKDSRPSLQVNPARQIWKCWVCDIGGDVFSFLMQEEGLTFPEALRELADRAGIEISSPTTSQGGRRTRTNHESARDLKERLYQTMKWAADVYQQHLLNSSQAEKGREYLEDRGFALESIQKFSVGLAADGWSNLLDKAKQENISPQLLEQCGLALRKEGSSHYYDRFRNRVMFPIRDRNQRVIAFGGRVLPGTDDGAKYINSPETRLFQKSKNLYGMDIALDSIRRQRQALVMEGYTDVIFAHQAGIENAVAVLGTALGQPHIKLLKHYCDSIVLLLDGDEAGQRRSDEVLELFLHADIDVRVISLPDGLDPADFLIQHGAGELNKLIEDSVDALEFRMRRASRGFDPLTDTHRANQAIEEMLGLLAKVPHSGLISNESFRLRQNQILPRLAREFAVPETTLRERLSSLRERQNRFRARSHAADEPVKERLIRPGDLTPFERELLELIIIAPQVAPIALERVQSGWLESEASRAMLDAYLQLDFSGESLEFESVLSALEDSSLKSLLVTLHEQANAKLKTTRQSAEERLQVLTLRMGEQKDVVRRQQQISQLLKPGLSEDEELGMLQEVVLEARLRQGLVNQLDPNGVDEAEQPMAPQIEATEGTEFSGEEHDFSERQTDASGGQTT